MMSVEQHLKVRKISPGLLIRIMTLEAYSPERLDELALRALDVCCRLRRMAQRSRREELGIVSLHDKKALEWLAKLEEWADKTEADLEVQVLRSRGQRKALAVRMSPEYRDAKPE
jgi:hypothetical protein